MNSWLKRSLSLSWWRDQLSAYHIPKAFQQQATQLGTQLPYEDLLHLDDWEVIILSDGDIGVCWKLTLTPHETLKTEDLVNLSTAVARVFEGLETEQTVAQLLFDSEPDWKIDTPTWNAPQNTSQEVVQRRIEHLEAFASGVQLGSTAFRTMRRSLHLTLRMPGWNREPGSRVRFRRMLLGAVEADSEVASEFEKNLRILLDLAIRMEEGLGNLGLAPSRLQPDAILSLLRTTWHDEANRVENPLCKTAYDASKRLGDQVACDFSAANRAGVQVGKDTWQVVSWLEQPEEVQFGLYTLLLGIGYPHRLVLTLRPCTNTYDFQVASAQLAAPLLNSERKRRHVEELRHVEECMAHGETLLHVGMHLLIKNEGCPLEQLQDDGVARKFPQKRWADFYGNHDHLYTPFFLLLSNRPSNHSSGGKQFIYG